MLSQQEERKEEIKVPDGDDDDIPGEWEEFPIAQEEELEEQRVEQSLTFQMNSNDLKKKSIESGERPLSNEHQSPLIISSNYSYPPSGQQV